MKCKYQELNDTKNLCKDYYYHLQKKSLKEMTLNVLEGDESEVKIICKCRLAEWKKKQKTCPYDANIKSCSRKKKGQMPLEKFKYTLKLPWK